MRIMLSENRVNQIIAESIRLFENQQVLDVMEMNFNYLQSAYNVIANLNPNNKYEAQARQCAMQFSMSLLYAMDRCMKAQNLNESAAGDFWASMPIGRVQGSNAAGFLGDVGIKLPSTVNAAVRGYKNGRNWMEDWGKRYIQARRRREAAKANAQQQQAQQQGQQQQGQQQQQITNINQVTNNTPFLSLKGFWPSLKNDMVMYDNYYEEDFKKLLYKWMDVVDECFNF